MLPVLLSIGPVSISSFGFFLALAFLFGTFLVWRIARAWDLPEEKILDLIILSFFGGLIGSRIFFVSLNFEYFSGDLLKTVLVTKYPGMNFWGGLAGGWLTLFVLSKRLRLNFWQMADLAAVGLLGGLIFGDIGCFLGGCSVGVESNFFLSTPVVGVLGKRFPVSALEALLVAGILIKIWPTALHFHFHGKILSFAAISLGLVKLLTEFFRDLHQGGFYLSAILTLLGVSLFYYLSKRSFRKDILSLKYPSTRKTAVDAVLKNWYNFKVSLTWKISKWKLSKILKRLHVKPTPRDIQ